MAIPVQNIYYLLSYAWDRLEAREKVKADVEDATEIIDLFARVLCTALKQLSRVGLHRGYVEHRDEIRTIRGRVCITETLNILGFKRGRLVCDYDELTHNILPNQILKATLRLMNRASAESAVRDRITEQLRYFHDVSDIRLDGSAFSRVVLHRNNRLYGFLMDVCQIVWRNLLPNERTGRWEFRSFLQNPKTMGLLFEHFVRNFFKYHRNEIGFDVGRENIKWTWTALDSVSEGMLPQMATDIVLRNSTRKLLFECKFASITKNNQFESSRLISGHLYQLNAYLTHLPGTEENEKCEAILLYPSDGIDYRLRYQSEKRRIQVRTIDLNRKWQLIHNELLNLPNELLVTA